MCTCKGCVGTAPCAAFFACCSWQGSQQLRACSALNACCLGPAWGLESERSSSCCSRYDYEGVESEKAEKMIKHVRDIIAKANKGDSFGEFKLEKADDFEYKVGFLLLDKSVHVIT